MEVTISGSKNAVLPIMAASLLTNEKCQIMDVPRLRDVDVMCSILSRVGAEVEEDYGNNQLYIEAGDILENEAPYPLVNKMRASVLLMGPLLARTGRAKMPIPGGCAIGARPIDCLLYTSNHEDIFYVRKDGNSIKDENMSALQERLKNKPLGERNIAIVEDADTMTLRAQNRILKTLEEPPSGTVIILLSENTESRCV